MVAMASTTSGKGTSETGTERVDGTVRVKRGLAEMLKGGVIMDVVTPEQAKIAEDAGAVRSWLSSVCRPTSGSTAAWPDERSRDDRRHQGRHHHPGDGQGRIGHFVEAQILEALGVDYVDESEVLTPADEAHHIDKFAFTVPFVCGATNLGEALRRISEGACMIRSKGEAGTGNVVEAVRHLRSITGDIRKITQADSAELFEWAKAAPGSAAAHPGDRRDRQASGADVLRWRPRHPGRCRHGDAARAPNRSSSAPASSRAPTPLRGPRPSSRRPRTTTIPPSWPRSVGDLEPR